MQKGVYAMSNMRVLVCSILAAMSLLVMSTVVPCSAATYEDSVALADQIRNDNPGLSINLSTEDQRSAYAIGEKIVLTFSVSKDCYLTLIDIGTDGQALVLFPNKYHPDNKVQGGQQYRIPPEGSQYVFRLHGPANRPERIKAIASLEPVLANAPALQQELQRPVEQEPRGGTFLTIKNTEQVLTDILAALSNMDTSKWSTSEVLFQVNEAAATPVAPSGSTPTPPSVPQAR
jgi:hypothetical protein